MSKSRGERGHGAFKTPKRAEGSWIIDSDGAGENGAGWVARSTSKGLEKSC